MTEKEKRVVVDIRTLRGREGAVGSVCWVISPLVSLEPTGLTALIRMLYSM